MELFTLFDIISIILITISATLGWTFVTLYSREDWEDYPAGRHLMKFTLGVAVICTWVVGTLVVRLFVTPSPMLELLIYLGRIVTFAWLCWMLTERIKLLRSETRKRDDRERQRSDLH